MFDFLKDLDENQLSAVKYNDGPQLVIAGAGAGKTRVLTYKIAYLLKNGVKPWNILALTFTNKAADEMKERIGTLVGEKLARQIHMGTFHSVFYRILRNEINKIDYKPNFTIYDESDSKSLVNSIIKEYNIDDKKYSPGFVLNQISYAKNNLINVDDFSVNGKTNVIGTIYREYIQRCHIANVMDFDDLLVLTYRLFMDNPEILADYADRFRYVLVDEYQDTNYVQQKIIELFYRKNAFICLVGDDAQSIYSFRGANIDYILEFPKKNGFEIFKLEQNYRSTKNIVAAANSLIKHNEHQIYKDVYSKKDVGGKLDLKVAYSDREEACIVCNEIRRIKRQSGCDYKDFCVLYRTNSQSRVIEEELINKSIPYKIFGGLNFYQRKEIKDIIAYFRLTVNTDDEEAIRRVINYPVRGIGTTTLKKLTESAKANSVSIWEVISFPDKYRLNVKSNTKNKLIDFHDFIEECKRKSNELDAYELGVEIIDKSGIKGVLYSNGSPEDVARQQNVEELLSALKDFVDNKKEEGQEDFYISDFLQTISLISNIDDNNNDDNTVSLMTIHSAKGLEFSTVFIVGVEENIIPNIRMSSSLREIEEERRLMYVAITRAQMHCIITYAKSRYRYGKMEFCRPSRFISEIDSNYIHNNEADIRTGTDSAKWGRASNMFTNRHVKVSHFTNENLVSKNRPMESDISASVDYNSDVKIGDIIEHQRFGIGTIEMLDGEGENTKATVRFNNAGTKQLLLKFAKYKIIS